MRIAHVTDCYLPRLGGIEQQVRDLALAQHGLGHDVSILTSVAGDPRDGPLRVWRPAAEGPADRIHYASSLRTARRLAAGGYDVVHLHVSTGSPLALSAARVATSSGLPVAASVHSLWDRATPLMRSTSRVLGWGRWPIAWSAVSEAAAGPVRRTVSGPVQIIPNGVAVERWPRPPFPRRPDRVAIASVMRLAARKRPIAFVRLLGRLREAVPDSIELSATIIGDGPQRSRVEREIARLGLDDWACVLGRLPRDQITEHFRGVDVYVAPAKLESFGIAALEARAAGLPVVGFRRTGIAGFVRNGVDGLLVDDDAQMAAAVARLVRDARLRHDITAHNRRHLPATGWDDVLGAYFGLYERAGAVLARPADAAYLVDELSA